MYDYNIIYVYQVFCNYYCVKYVNLSAHMNYKKIEKKYNIYLLYSSYFTHYRNTTVCQGNTQNQKTT
jgi:hypothetical protein